MLLTVLRGGFLIAMMAVAVAFVLPGSDNIASSGYWATQKSGVALILIAIGIGIFFIAVDILVPRKALAAISGMFFGLVVGMLVAYGLSLVVELLVSVYADPGDVGLRPVVQSINLTLGVICCYLAVSFILQTKDDIRFVIPYVEFTKQSRGARPWILDTSVIIDGRIADVCKTPIIDAPIIVPRFVLEELQNIADSSNKLRRNRGRRGLDVLDTLQHNEKLDVQMPVGRFTEAERAEPVDTKLIIIAKQLGGHLVTTDFNLNKVATLRGVDVINLNELSNAVKAVVLPGEKLSVKVIKPGEEYTQGVGYLDDGTMIVIEDGREYIHKNIEVTVTSVLQTNAGRMIFGRVGLIPDADSPAPSRRRPPRGRT